MELSPKQQVVDLINKASKILLVTHSNPDGDALGSILAMYLALKKLGKDPTAVCIDTIPSVFSFLPSSSEILPTLEGIKDFIITLDCSKAQAEKLSYNLENSKLNIIITPKDGQFNPEDVSFSYGTYKFDLIIVLDSADLEMLGLIYDKNIKLFYETPTINIDHHSTNENFGQCNLVELTATSTCEILVSLLEALDAKLIDPDVATCLLAGITTDTGSFQNTNTTPKSLTMAAQLVAAGARQQEIIRSIYKTKPLTTLKLWGKILSRIKFDPESKLAWSVVSFSDFEEEKATPEQTAGVIDELLSSVPEAEIILLLSEKKPGEISGSLRAKGTNAAEIAGLFGGGGHPGAAGFQLSGVSLEEVEEKITEAIKKFRRGEKIEPEQKPVEEISEGSLASSEEKKTEETQKPIEETKELEEAQKDAQRPGEEENESQGPLSEQKKPAEEISSESSGKPSSSEIPEEKENPKEDLQFEEWIKKVRGEE